MILADLVHGDSVFLDADTLIYHFGPHPQFGPACHQLVQRIENQDLLGFTSTHILTEVAHRLTKLASHDADLDRVPGLTRYAPA